MIFLIHVINISLNLNLPLPMNIISMRTAILTRLILNKIEYFIKFYIIGLINAR